MKALVPRPLEPLVIALWYRCRPLVRVLFAGRNRYCPICDSWTRLFLTHGPPSKRRPDQVCPVCLSHGRHRLAWLYLTARSNLTDGAPKTLLHIAPETELAHRFRRMPRLWYVSADIRSPHAMEQIDVTDMPWPDASFDVVFCSHVLEHVADDRRAMREVLRVLKPGGWALIQVPTSEAPTADDPAVTDPGERERLYWQADHVRLYGLDIEDRLTTAGFQVEVVLGREVAGPEDRERMAVGANAAIFHCRRPPRPD